MNVFVWRRSKQSFKIFGYFAIVSMPKKLLHRDRHVGVLARVYAHFVRWVCHVLNKFHWHEHQCMVCTLYRCFWHQFTYLQKHCPQGLHVRPCMRSLSISIGRPGFQLDYAGLLLLVSDVYIHTRKVGIYVFVYVFKVHMCIYMLGGGMRFWPVTTWFFLQHIFPSDREKQKMWT